MSRRDVIQVRVSEEEKSAISEYAKHAGLTPSEYIRRRALAVTLETAQAGGQETPEVGDADERTPAPSRGSLKTLPPDTAAQHDAADPLLQPLRACEKCGKEYGSPSLRRCLECNGKIVPEPA